jgi:hypothetical protein
MSKMELELFCNNIFAFFDTFQEKSINDITECLKLLDEVYKQENKMKYISITIQKGLSREILFNLVNLLFEQKEHRELQNNIINSIYALHGL